MTRRHPIRTGTSEAQQLGRAEEKYAVPLVEVAPMPQTVWVPQININGAKAYTPNRMYLAALKGVVADFRVGYALFGLGCAAGSNVGHAIYRAEFTPAGGIQLRRVWSAWFDGPKTVEGGDDLSAAAVVLQRGEQYFFAAVSNQASPNTYVLAYENATNVYGLYYDSDVTRANGFPDVIPGNALSRDAEFMIGGYCFPTSYLAGFNNPAFNINLFF